MNHGITLGFCKFLLSRVCVFIQVLVYTDEYELHEQLSVALWFVMHFGCSI